MQEQNWNYLRSLHQHCEQEVQNYFIKMLFASCLHVVRGVNCPVLRTDNEPILPSYQNTTFWRKFQWSIWVRFCLHLLFMCPSQSPLPAKSPPCPSFLTATTIALPFITSVSLAICSVKIVVSSVPFAFYIYMSCFHRAQCECGIIPRKPVADTIPYVDCFLVTGFIPAKFFILLWKVLIPLLIL